MSLVLLVVILALGWAAITGNFDGLNLLLGGLLGALAVTLLRSAVAPPRVVRRLRHIVSLVGLFLYELMASAIRVAILVLTPNLKSRLRPAIVAFPLSVKSDAEITLLANLITLTPGTLSVDVSENRQILYVHVLSLTSRDGLIAEIADGFEARVREIFA